MQADLFFHANSRRPGGFAIRALSFIGLLTLGSAALAAPTWDDVGPLFASRCTLCHNGEGAPNGLQLGSYAAALKGSVSGPVFKPGASAGSELIRRLKGESQPRMPMTGPPFLSDAEIALVAAWIDGGALPSKANATSDKTAAAAPTAAPVAPVAARKPGDPVTWAEVEPILLARCAKCHSENGIMGAPPEGFIVRSHAQTLAAGERVRVIPRQPQASELLRRVRGLSRPRMPFDGPPWLSETEIDLIEQWISDGARDRAGKPAPIPVGASVRFRGILTGPEEIDGMPFDGGGARIDKAPRVGSEAELRGSVQSDGSIRATRLRRR
jgi:uncharacterized membrane protein